MASLNNLLLYGAAIHREPLLSVAAPLGTEQKATPKRAARPKIACDFTNRQAVAA
jgi:hypothetical protein